MPHHQPHEQDGEGHRGGHEAIDGAQPGPSDQSGGSTDEVRRLWVRCAKCNLESGPFEVAEEKDLRCLQATRGVKTDGQAFQMLGMCLHRALASGSSDDHLPKPSDHHPAGATTS